MFVPRSGLGAAIDTLAQTIITVEGTNPNFAANNNPGNLVYVGQSGAVAGSGGFAKFPTYDAGYAALENQINLYASRGMTVQDMMNVYCPASSPGCNPTAYANTVAGALGVPTTTLVSDAISGSDPSVLDTTGDGTDGTDTSGTVQLAGMTLTTQELAIGGAILLTALYLAFR